MAYRNGTYIAFHAAGTTDPTASDIKYYRLLKAWHESDGTNFRFVNSHEKVAAVRDSSTKETLRRSLKARLDASKNMVLILGPTTKDDTDWVPYEIGYAVDSCGIPLIVAYTGYDKITAPLQLSSLWPAALIARYVSGSLRAIHVPFKQAAIDDAIGQFHLSNLPTSGVDYYTVEAHRKWGLIK